MDKETRILNSARQTCRTIPTLAKSFMLLLNFSSLVPHGKRPFRWFKQDTEVGDRLAPGWKFTISQPLFAFPEAYHRELQLRDLQPASYLLSEMEVKTEAG